MVFEVVIGEETWGTIAVDDVKVSPGSCSMPVTCTFDSEDLCLWSQNEQDDLNWLFHHDLDGLEDHSDRKWNALVM